MELYSAKAVDFQIGANLINIQKNNNNDWIGTSWSDGSLHLAN